MSRYRSVLSNAVFFLLVLLLLMAAFSEHLKIPVWLTISGRFHPLLLHFPITLVILLLVTYPFRSAWKNNMQLSAAYDLLWLHAAGLAALSALSGLVLSTDGGYDETTLDRHMWLGTATAAIAYVIWYLQAGRESGKGILNILVIICGVTLGVGSHYGGTLTHGEDYLTFRTPVEESEASGRVTDSTAIYLAAVQPLLQTKCYSCHNEKKSKGDFVMTQEALLLKGGKEGAPWVAGNPDNSRLVQRLLLDMTDKKHMPPKGKPQLSSREIELLHKWIADGADFDKSFQDYPSTDTFRIFAASFIQPADVKKTKTMDHAFEPADKKTLANLNGPFRVITSLDNRTPALRLGFYVSSEYKPSMLEDCRPLSLQIVSANLSGMPAGDEAVQQLSGYPNIEEIFLHSTRITGANLALLKQSTKLRTLSLSNTKVNAMQIEPLAALPMLEKVFLWKTNVTDAEAKILQKKYPRIQWDIGYIPDTKEFLKLTSPQLKNAEKMVFATGETITLKHPMSGAGIRYTTDGSDPDSINTPLFTKPIPVNGPTQVKAIAVMSGWHASSISAFTVFSRGILPAFSSLLTKPDNRYKQQGAASLTDGNKGESNNSLVNWLGFRDEPFKAHFSFAKEEAINKVTLSMADNNGSYIMPPAVIIVKGGTDSLKMIPIGRLAPKQPSTYGPVENRIYTVGINPGKYRYIHIQADPVSKLPEWHRGKGQKGWVFVDEVFFY